MQKLAESTWNEAEAIKANAMRLTWYMRGGIQYTDVLNMSTSELTQLNKLIESNLETTKKTKLPFF